MRRALALSLALALTAGQALAGFEDGLRAYRLRDYGTAIKEFRAVATDESHSEAMYYLGNMYVRGLGINQSDKEAMHWFLTGAELGNQACQFNVGLMLYEGRGIKKDFERAYFWFTISSKGDAADVADLAGKNRETVKKRLTPEQIADVEALVGIWRPKRR